MSDEMHTGYEWSELLKDTVLDADGWRGREFYELEISRDDYNKRLNVSTIMKRIVEGRNYA